MPAGRHISKGIPLAIRKFMERRRIMAAKKFGYARVSSREQNLDRQVHILRDEEGILSLIHI